MDGMAAAAKKYTDHDMIRKHTVLPDYPELRASVLRAFLRHGTGAAASPNLLETIAMAVSLAQYGLDTHELVDGKGELRRRQMTVLAGDYFSSRFYQLLSQAGNVASIRLLSQSICEVNRLKMALYAKMKRLLLTAEEYLRSMVDINTHLFVAFASWMDGVCRKACPAVLRAIAECELIAREFGRTRPETVEQGWAFWYILQHGTPEEAEWLAGGAVDPGRLQALLNKYNVRGVLADLWEEKLEELRAVLKTIQSDKLAEELTHLVQPLFAFRNSPKVLEEI